MPLNFLSWNEGAFAYVCVSGLLHTWYTSALLEFPLHSIINKLCFKLYYPRPPSNSESFHCNPLVKENQKLDNKMHLNSIYKFFFKWVSFLWVLSRFYSAFHLVLLSHVLMWLSYLYGGWNLLSMTLPLH